MFILLVKLQAILHGGAVILEERAGWVDSEGLQGRERGRHVHINGVYYIHLYDVISRGYFDFEWSIHVAKIWILSGQLAACYIDILIFRNQYVMQEIVNIIIIVGDLATHETAGVIQNKQSKNICQNTLTNLVYSIFDKL